MHVSESIVVLGAVFGLPCMWVAVHSEWCVEFEFMCETLVVVPDGKPFGDGWTQDSRFPGVLYSKSGAVSGVVIWMLSVLHEQSNVVCAGVVCSSSDERTCCEPRRHLETQFSNVQLLATVFF